MSKFAVRGGVPLKGSVRISGAKNAAIKMIAASLLTSEEIVITDVPAIDDVNVDIDVVRALGVKVERLDGEVRLKADEVATTSIPRELSKKTRAAVVCLGPLLARFGKIDLPFPGGCKIGKRPIDRHLSAMESLGAEIVCEDHLIKARADHLVGAPIRFEKNTVMGTENAILAATMAEGETVIFGAAQEPEVDDLIKLLVSMGANIERSIEEPSRITVKGVDELGGAKHSVIPDRCEVVTYAIAAAATRGDIVLENVRPADLTSFFAKFSEVGGSYEVMEDRVRFWADTGTVFEPTDIETKPHPGFMTDWQQPFSVLLAQAEGESKIHETIYPQRFDYLEELKKFGVKAELMTPTEAGMSFDPDKYGFNWSEKEGEPKVVAEIGGPVELQGTEAKITDLRAGATLVIAALAAEGESVVSGIEHIDRGYENFEVKLQNLGADIERV
ncbi:MAG: UDP-N-acetylglucosamine 1-carboxyvinyltransferase [Patescibacteria group bacterium]